VSIDDHRPGDLVLDPTCGSGTTAYVAEQWGRRWITIDTSRVALALARTRLMAARFPYYLLADSPAGRKKEAEMSGAASVSGGVYPRRAESNGGTENGGDEPRSGSHGGDEPRRSQYDLRKGFVYKRVPHVTLKSIANNPDIKEGMTREQIDAAIKKYAETEVLYDQPYEDKSVVRVSGPFTVESLSPHRMLPAAEEGGVTDGGDKPRRSTKKTPPRLSPQRGLSLQFGRHLIVSGRVRSRRGRCRGCDHGSPRRFPADGVDYP
jgi:adenine-specific DNA-methyltransferase